MKLSPFHQFSVCWIIWFHGLFLSSATVIDALDQRTEYEYNEDGQRTVQRDALGRETTYTYDDLGPRIGRTLPGGQSESSTYDAVGTLQTRTDFNGHTTRYSYDVMSRLTGVNADSTHPSLGLANAPRRFAFTYDRRGQRTRADSFSQGNQLLSRDAWGYDRRSQLTTHTANGTVIAYIYDGAGNQTSAATSTASGYGQAFRYDGLNRLSAVMATGTDGSDELDDLAGYPSSPIDLN